MRLPTFIIWILCASGQERTLRARIMGLMCLWSLIHSMPFRFHAFHSRPMIGKSRRPCTLTGSTSAGQVIRIPTGFPSGPITVPLAMLLIGNEKIEAKAKFRQAQLDVLIKVMANRARGD